MSSPGDARTALLQALFDDAGLFPPASLTMADAAATHRRSRGGPNAWMLARFVCPASRLSELAGLIGGHDAPAWRVSAILDGPDPAAALEAVEAFAVTGATVDAAEARAADVSSLAKTLESTAFPGFCFAEVAPGPDWGQALEDVRAAAQRGVRLGAKIRCGGATTPEPGEVAAFLVRCRDLGVRAKATAGLHHPVRHRRDGTMQHGFLNVAVAAALCHGRRLDEDATRAIVEEEDPGAFALEAGRVAWRDVTADAAAVAASRDRLFASVGSCSFDEPVEDLTALGVLPIR